MRLLAARPDEVTAVPAARTAAVEKFAAAQARAAQIPAVRAGLVADRDRMAKAGRVDDVVRIDAEIHRLDIEASVAAEAWSTLLQAADREARSNAEADLAVIALRRERLVDTAEPVLRRIVDACAELAAIRAASGLGDDYTPRIFFDAAGWAANAGRWLGDYFPEMRAAAGAARTVLTDRSTIECP